MQQNDNIVFANDAIKKRTISDPSLLFVISPFSVLLYLSRKDRITAHFTTCFTALVIYRILEQKLNEKFTCEELIKTIRSMDMMIAPGEGYIPTYTRTDITDTLHDAFGFRTDYQITSQKNMRKILNQTKRK